VIRRGTQADVPFMRAMLVHAYHWHVAGLDTEIPLSRYVDGWGKSGDTAVIAAEGTNRWGAAWCRRFPRSAHGYGFVDDETPELTIAVVPSKRRHGVGQELLDRLLEKARAEGVARLSLSVQKGSDAIAFYERNGFTQVSESDGALTIVKLL
jgi:GNAT superfamily N-acetyltransferase